jgi:hypothetical protein
MLYNSNKKCIKTLEKKKQSPNFRMHSIYFIEYIYIYIKTIFNHSASISIILKSELAADT